MDKDSRQIFESYRLINESTDFEEGKTYLCEDIFNLSNYKKQDFYYVRAGYGEQEFVEWFREYKLTEKNKNIEVYGFKNLTNPKMEYNYSYLFRITSDVKTLAAIYNSLQYTRGIQFIPYSEEGVVTPEGNDDALKDIMLCDLFLPHIDMKPETRKHFGDIFSATDQ